MAPPKKLNLPKPLPDGFILADGEKKQWRLGKIVGEGGFGVIYLASQDVSRPVAADADFVIKVEYQDNGPLFSELKFYQRAAKPDSIQKWKKVKKLDFLGIPKYWGSGLAEHKDLRYRFMAMDRLGSDLQKICERNGGRLKKTTVLQLGQRLVDVLEYIHENEYVHADIKAANLMLGYRNPNQVYLADYGLSYRYCPDGVHKEYKENPKKGHNGTIEYTSLDAHNGVAPSRRGDLQILGFCLLHWLCGSLPWDNVLKNPTQVQEAKIKLMDNLPFSVQQLSASGASTDELAKFLIYVRTLGYEDKPDYQLLKKLLACEVTGKLDFSVPGGHQGSAPKEPFNREKKKRKMVRPDAERRPQPPFIPQNHFLTLRGRVTALSTAQFEGADDTHFTQHRPRKEGAARRPSRPKQVTPQLDDEEPVSIKPRPVPARCRRGPPPTKPEKKAMSPAGGRSLRPRPPCTYEEEDSEEEEQEEEEEEEEEADVRPKRIPARYLRGPPIGPGAMPKQRAKSKGPHKNTEELTRTNERPQHQLNLQMGNYGWAEFGRDREIPKFYRKRLEERPHENGMGHSQICSEQGHWFGETEDSDLRQGAASIQRTSWMSRLVCVGLILLLGAVFVFA